MISAISTLFSSHTFSQDPRTQKIDGLKKHLPSFLDNARVDSLLKISFEYGHANGDSDNLFHPVDNDSAIRFAALALTESKRINYPEGMANAFENLGEMATNHDFHEGENDFRQAIALYIKVHDFENLNWSYLWLGYYLMFQCRFDEAREAYHKALSYYLQMNNEPRQARAYGLIARSYIMQGYYKDAIGYCLKDISILQSNIKYHSDPIIIRLRIAELYLAAGDSLMALTYFSQSIPYSRAYNICQYWETMGDIHFLRNNYDSAIYYYHLANPSAKNTKMGEMYILKKEYDKALPYFMNDIASEKRRNNIYTEMALSEDIAKTYLGKKKIETSLRYSASLLKTARSVHARQFTKDGYSLIWKIYDQQKRTDSAYKYRLLFDDMNDSVFRDDLAKNIAVAEMKSSDEKKQSRIDLLNKDNQIKQEQLQKESLIKKILIAGIIVFLIFVIIVFRNIMLQRKNEKLQNENKQAELQKHSAELEMQALRAQMNPHFIFNCLSSINRFILKHETEEASDYLTKFSRLIRMVLSNSNKTFITLEDELDMFKLYLDMERLRFKNSFDYKITFINSIDDNNVFVPPLLLQPFAENAIWHGLMHKEGPGHLEIALSIENKILTCIITDNGIGRKQSALLKSKSAEKQKSMGLAITTKRLALVNSNMHQETYFDFEDIIDEAGNLAGTKVTLKIQYRDFTELSA